MTADECALQYHLARLRWLVESFGNAYLKSEAEPPMPVLYCNDLRGIDLRQQHNGPARVLARCQKLVSRRYLPETLEDTTVIIAPPFPGAGVQLFMNVVAAAAIGDELVLEGFLLYPTRINKGSV